MSYLHQSGLLYHSTLGSVSDYRDYDSYGELVHYVAQFGGNTLIDTQYSYDIMGRITSITETLDGQITVHSYEYDVRGRLVGVEVTGVQDHTYTYDANSNRMTGPGGPGIYDEQDRLLQWGSDTYTYTANGHLKAKTVDGQITAYDYDVLGNLMKVTFADGTIIDYLIDGFNRRVGKRINGVLVQSFVYQDDLNPVAELDDNGNIVSRFVYASRTNVPDYMFRDGKVYRIIVDHIGSPRLIVEIDTGYIAQRIDYDEFGNIVSDTNPGFQPFAFAGGLYDQHTQLVRFGARDYDPTIGRWLSKDQSLFSGGSSNLYVYALSDPINYVDADGYEVTEESTKMAGLDVIVTSAKTGDGITAVKICLADGSQCLEYYVGRDNETPKFLQNDVKNSKRADQELRDNMSEEMRKIYDSIIDEAERAFARAEAESKGEGGGFHEPPDLPDLPDLSEPPKDNTVLDFADMKSNRTWAILCPDGTVIYTGDYW